MLGFLGLSFLLLYTGWLAFHCLGLSLLLSYNWWLALSCLGFGVFLTSPTKVKMNLIVPGNKDVYSVAIPFLSGLYSFKFSFLLLSNFKQTFSLSSEIHGTSTSTSTSNSSPTSSTTSMQDQERLRKHVVSWAFDDLFLCWAWALEHAQSHQHMPVVWVWLINHRYAEQKMHDF